MSPDVLEFSQVMEVIVMSVASFTVIGLGARVLWRLGNRKTSALAAPRDDERMQRLEQAVDAIAIEVERISEGQRFVVGLLSDGAQVRRAGLAGVERSDRVDTPH